MKGELKIKSKFDMSEDVESVAVAEIDSTGGQLSIFYNEDNDGYTSTHSKISLANNVVSLNRLGKFPANFIFEQGKKNSGSITTPMGKMDLSTFAHFVSVAVSAKKINVHLKYDMIIQGVCSFCDMKIECNFFGGNND